MAATNLVYLSYGSDTEYRRAVFSILSFWFRCKSCTTHTRVIVYTDRPDFFRPFFPDCAVEYFLLTPENLEEMLAGTGFIHRRKIAVIDLTFQHYPDDNVLYIDSDTFFISDPENLFSELDKKTSLMHKREYALKDAPQVFGVFNQAHFPNAYLGYMKDKTFEIGDNKESFNQDDYNWNAGVLGLNKDFKSYLPNIYQLTDDSYAHSKWFVCEQLAFALVLQHTTKVKPTDNVILHYWGKRQKVMMDRLLTHLFKSKINMFPYFSIEPLTLKWSKKVADDLILEQAVLALAGNLSLYGLKKTFFSLLRNPFDGDMYRELLGALKTQAA